MAADVRIDIAAEFTGKKAFRQAETASDKLTKNVKKLAGSLGLAFGTQQIVAYGKRAVKAFADSELEATRLNTAVSNLGLAFAAPQIDRYIDKIELATGVNRDQLQPAFLTLLQTTGSLTKSQELLNLSLDVAAGTGADVASVSTKLAQAYVGNAKGLRSLNLGLTTAELNSADFETVQKRITQLFAGQGAAAAESYVGQMSKLSIASEQASEIIGGGLVDSLIILSGNTSVTELADDMLVAARNTATLTSNLATLVKTVTAPIKFLADGIAELARVTSPFAQLIIEGDPSGFMTKKPPAPSSAPVAGFNGKTFYADAQKNADAIAKAETTAKKRAAELLAIKKKQQLLEGKILKDKKLQNAIDKANLLLGKGDGIFDLEKIQIAAALTNQAELLGRATEGSQLLQIANDTARLNVKRSILALEEAIASKDEAAIVAATAKLNEDLKILGALTNQKTQMVAIESILKGLAPKDLIDQKNLDDALDKIKKMLGLLNDFDPKKLFNQTPNAISAISAPRTTAQINEATAALGGVISVIGDNGKEFTKLVDGLPPVFQTVEDSAAFNALVNTFANGAVGGFNSGSFRTAEGGGLFNSGAVGARDINITIQANTIANPDELTNMIQDSIIRINRRGDALTQAGSL